MQVRKQRQRGPDDLPMLTDPACEVMLTKIHVSVHSSFNFSIFHLLNFKTLTLICSLIYQGTIKILLFLSKALSSMKIFASVCLPNSVSFILFI